MKFASKSRLPFTTQMLGDMMMMLSGRGPRSQQTAAHRWEFGSRKTHTSATPVSHGSGARGVIHRSRELDTFPEPMAASTGSGAAMAGPGGEEVLGFNMLAANVLFCSQTGYVVSRESVFQLRHRSNIRIRPPRKTINTKKRRPRRRIP